MAQRARMAVLFILLLAGTEAYQIQSSAAQTSMALALTSLARGAEAARASGEAGVLQRDESLQQMIHDLKKSLSNHTLRSPVCSSDINPSSAVERYTRKCEKLTQLAAEYNQEGCISGCPRWLGEVKQRMNEFKSCLSDPQGLPSDLKDIMFSGDMAMKKVMLQAQRDLLGPAKRKGTFLQKGHANFCHYTQALSRTIGSVSHGQRFLQILQWKKTVTKYCAAKSLGLDAHRKTPLENTLKAFRSQSVVHWSIL